MTAGSDYIGSDGKLLTDGVIYPAQTKSVPLPMLDSSDPSYYSADHSTCPEVCTEMLARSCDGVIPLKYIISCGLFGACSLRSHEPWRAGADYIGSNSDGVSNLTAPGTIYPGYKYGVWGAVSEQPQGVAPTMLADGSHSLPADHSGAFYCT